MTSAAGILFRSPEGRVLLVEREDGSGWGIPGGKLEGDETPEEAAVRECREELGTCPDGPRRAVSRRDFGGVDYTTFVQAVDEEFTPIRLTEHTAFRWTSPDEALGAVRMDSAEVPSDEVAERVASLESAVDDGLEDWSSVMDALKGLSSRVDAIAERRGITARHDDDYEESKHPRDASGKFTSGGKSTPVSTEGWKRSGPQLGSNTGGKFTSPDGKVYYSKRAKSEAHARNEVLAGQLYKAAGSPGVAPSLTKVGDGHGTAAEWQDVSKFDPKDPEQRREAADHMMTHAWLGNWDAVGLGYDNQGRIGDEMHTLDVGGAMAYRAQGAHKGAAWGDEATEVNSLRDPKVNHQASRVFGPMTADEMRASAKRVLAVPDSKIEELVEEHGHGSADDKAALARRLIARRESIRKYLES